MLQHGRSILRTPVAEMAGSLGLTPIARISIDFKYLLGQPRALAVPHAAL
jgi:hypothetical protein